MSKTTIPTGGITDATIATGDIADSAVTLAKTSNVGNLVKIAGTDVTSDTAGVELQSCFNNTYDSYMMVVRRFIPATNNQNLQMQIMTGTNTVVSATNYFYAFRYFEETNSVGGLRDDDGTFFALGGSVTNTEQDGGFSGSICFIYINKIASGNSSMTCYFKRVTGSYLINVDKTDTSGNSFKITGHGGVINVNGDLTAYFGEGVYNDTTNDVNPTGLKFTAASGDVSKLQVTVYGIAE